MEFEWDPVKADANAAKHGIRFPEAKAVFRDGKTRRLSARPATRREQRNYAVNHALRDHRGHPPARKST